MGPVNYFLSVGVDIGQKVDNSALCVAEEEPWEQDRRYKRYVVRFLERRPLQEDYPSVVRRIVEIVDKSIAIKCAETPGRFPMLTADGKRSAWERQTWLALDVTGVGRPVYDLLKDAFRHSNVFLQAVTFTYGDQFTGRGNRRKEVQLGKAYLVSRLQCLLQQARVKLPSTAEADHLAQELMDYEIRIDPDGNDKYGAFKTGAHDDLVTALGLACLDDHQLPQMYSC